MDKIQKTTNYDIFKPLRGNRHIIYGHVQKFKKLLNSDGRNNLLSSNPIRVNEQFEVIDGQHRLEAAKQLGIPVYYLVTNGGLREAIVTNSTVKVWSLQDFVDSYIDQGLSDYVVLDAYCVKYGLSISQGLEILCRNNGRRSQILKEGKFKFDGAKDAERIGEILVQIKPYLDLGVYGTRDFVRAIMLMHKSNKIRISDLLHSLAVQRVKIHREGSDKQYLRTIEDIYNYRRRNKIRLDY